MTGARGDRIILDDPWDPNHVRTAHVAWLEQLPDRLKESGPAVVILARLYEENAMHPSNEPGTDAAATIEMPRYQCHKKVWALHIGSVQPVVGGAAIITPSDTRYKPFEVDQAFVDRHKPQAGGYYVVYDGDGYKSFSPAKAFEDGYTLITGKTTRPTIDELEKILQEPDAKVNINSDGSVTRIE